MHLSQQLVDPGCPYSLWLATPHAPPVHYAGIAWLKDCSRPSVRERAAGCQMHLIRRCSIRWDSPPPEIQWTETHTPSLHSLFSGARSSTTTPIHIPGGHHGPLGRMAHSQVVAPCNPCWKVPVVQSTRQHRGIHKITKTKGLFHRLRKFQ